MTAKRRTPKPEPLQPGDAEIAREEIEAFYTHRADAARAELAAVQARFDRVQVRIAAFRAGERLPQVDAWEIEVAAYDRANSIARRDATARWLRREGYEPL